MDQRGRQKSVSQPSNPAQENFSNDSILKIRVKVGLASVEISKIWSSDLGINPESPEIAHTWNLVISIMLLDNFVVFGEKDPAHTEWCKLEHSKSQSSRQVSL